MRKVLSPEVLAIRGLNDKLRQSHQGGQVMVTRGIAALGDIQAAQILAAVAAFDAFTADNDPHGEHDCAILNWQDHKVMFKIDYYDPTLQYHSDDPTDPDRTVRVMTVMLASEY